MPDIDSPIPEAVGGTPGVIVNLPNVVEWPAIGTMGLPEYSISIPAELGPGLLNVYRVPAGEMGGWTYESFYNTTNIEQRPGCTAEAMTELARIRIAGAYGLIHSMNPGMLVQTVEYLHPDIQYHFAQVMNMDSNVEKELVEGPDAEHVPPHIQEGDVNDPPVGDPVLTEADEEARRKAAGETA